MSQLTLERRDQGFELSFAGRVILRHTPQAPCVALGRGQDHFEMYRGNFQVEDRLVERLPLDGWHKTEDGDALVLDFFLQGGAAMLRLAFRETAHAAGPRLDIEPTCSDPRWNRFWIDLAAAPEEHLYGCGEQFSYFDLRGRRFPLWTSEQGVGRNKATWITWKADVVDKAGGDYWWTFFPQPTFVSSARYWLHADSRAYAVFDFRAPDRHSLEFHEIPPRISLGTGTSIKACVQSLSLLLGRQPELPSWTQEGVILGIQGGTQTCLDKLAKVQARGVPVAGIWAQDWEGRRITSFGKRLMWDWQWDPVLYPGLDQALKDLKKSGVRFLGYINPYVAQGKPLCDEASRRGFLCKNTRGEDYMVDFGEFDAGIVDFTLPAAYDWYKQVIKTNLIDFGLAGWMADFGEYLPTDVVLADGTSAELAHNQWPALWAKVNREAVDEAGQREEILYFMRAGYTGSQMWCGMAWAGDQNVDWSEDDGLISVIPAALSLAMCGMGLHHSDTGGYTTLFGMKRTKELFQRWAELSAFTPLMRTHEGNRPDDNWQFDGDNETMDHFAAMGRIFQTLAGYRKTLIAENTSTGIGVMRPLFFENEGDPELWNLKDQFCLGPDLIVAPVVREGFRSRKVYLPAGTWVHLADGRVYSQGHWTVAAPVGRVPAFARLGSPWMEDFLAAGRNMV